MTFWYGLGFEDLCQMPMASIRHYLSKLPERQAEQRMMWIEAAQFPYLKKEARRRLIRELENTIGATRVVSKPIPAQLMLIGIGVELVSASEPMNEPTRVE